MRRRAAGLARLARLFGPFAVAALVLNLYPFRPQGHAFLLAGFTAAVFEAIGLKAEVFITQRLLPCGAMGAVLVASCLVEVKQSVIENMAPVLTRLFRPLLTLALRAFLATMLGTGRGIDVQRAVLSASTCSSSWPSASRCARPPRGTRRGRSRRRSSAAGPRRPSSRPRRGPGRRIGTRRHWRHPALGL